MTCLKISYLHQPENCFTKGEILIKFFKNTTSIITMELLKINIIKGLRLLVIKTHSTLWNKFIQINYLK